ncbi:MAG TPA: dienelactone hydrolase family protein [Stellaceae bacterium]|nr:dienelactone hydrolase family protein [Stellaceae bacterium]
MTLADVRGLFPTMNQSRRGFVMTSLATGFALSVRKAEAAIVTDSAGLTAGEVKIPVADGEMPAYRAEPDKGGPFPVLLVIEEVFGVHEHIKDMCRRFAKQGYLAVAPELYFRLGNPAAMTDIHQVIDLVNREPDAKAFADLDATVRWAGSQKGDAAKLGITGWCRGGRMTWMYASHNPSLKAGVAWYGTLSGKSTDAMPTHPLDVAASIKVPMLGLYGGKDQGIPADEIAEMEKRLKAAGDECQFIVYPDAEHGFNADYRESYNEKDATDAFAKCLDWLRKHGVG